MLGKFVKVRVTKPQGCFDRETNTKYLLNYGVVESGLLPRSRLPGLIFWAWIIPSAGLTGAWLP